MILEIYNMKLNEKKNISILYHKSTQVIQQMNIIILMVSNLLPSLSKKQLNVRNIAIVARVAPDTIHASYLNGRVKSNGSNDGAFGKQAKTNPSILPNGIKSNIPIRLVVCVQYDKQSWYSPLTIFPSTPPQVPLALDGPKQSKLNHKMMFEKYV